MHKSGKEMWGIITPLPLLSTHRLKETTTEVHATPLKLSITFKHRSFKAVSENLSEKTRHKKNVQMQEVLQEC